MTEQNLPKYSALMSVYERDKPEWFKAAIESMASQTHAPSEIVLIEDGPVTDGIRAVEARYPNLLRVIKSERNVGLGSAMAIGLAACANEWIARMDADDISDVRRCEEELSAATTHNADIIGCDCDEFIDTIEKATAKRLFPEAHEDIVRFSKHRTPFCHPAVMFRKSAAQNAGGYGTIRRLEDYDLFVRMLKNGAKGRNVKKILFHVRVSKDFYGRRGGTAYVGSMLAFNAKLLRSGWISPADFIFRSFGNIIVGCSPPALRSLLYRKLLRK